MHAVYELHIGLSGQGPECGRRRPANRLPRTELRSVQHLREQLSGTRDYPGGALSGRPRETPPGDCAA